MLRTSVLKSREFLLKLARRRPLRAGVVACALLSGSMVLMAPESSEARERCTTKPVVCARLKAMRAQRAPTPDASLLVRPAAPGARLQAAAVKPTEPRCTTKPTVCARMRTQPVAPAAAVPVRLAANPAAERCTTKPAVCARLKLGTRAEPVILANDEAPATNVD